MTDYQYERWLRRNGALVWKRFGLFVIGVYARKAAHG